MAQKPTKRNKPPTPEPLKPVAPSVADALARNLRHLEKTLEGRFQAKPEELISDADWLLLSALCNTMIQAHYEGLLTPIFDLRQVAPEAGTMIDAYASSRLTMKSHVADAADASTERAGNPASEVESLARIEASQREIDALLKEIDVHGDPGIDQAKLDIHTARYVLAPLWRFFHDNRARDLPAELSHQIESLELPGIDPWLGAALDLRKASWVAQRLAVEIEERCDLTISEASQISGINPGQISRMCKKSVAKGGIRCVGTKKQLRMNRASFQKYWTANTARVRKQQRQKNAKSPTYKEYFCTNCDHRYPFKPSKCENCREHDFAPVVPKNIRPAAAARNHRNSFLSKH